jgi:large subunit ribosomal protein L19
VNPILVKSKKNKNQPVIKMSNIIDSFNKQELERLKLLKTSPIKPFNVGDNVSVKYKITEGASTRIQAFNGVVIAKSKSFENYSATFTVRKISSGIGVERKFMLHSPLVSEVEILKKGVIRRAKLYYLRKLTGKASRIKEKLDF